MNFVSSLIGFAIGDAIGVPVEFLSRETLKNNPITDMEEYGTHNQPKGTWSDDTSMTIATISSILKNKNIDYNDIMNNFKEWMKNGKFTATDKCFDIGITCSSAIYKFDGSNALQCGEDSYYSNGNGSLMRILPLAFICYYNKYDDLKILESVRNLSSLTHSHEISVIGCYLYVKYLAFILNGNDKLESYKLLKELDLSFFGDDNLKCYDRILKKKIDTLKIKEIKSSGFVVDTLEAVLWCVLNTKNYKDSILLSVNLGDDTDTITAITGSISGILYGIDNMPIEWINSLKKKDELIELANAFEKILKEGEMR